MNEQIIKEQLTKIGLASSEADIYLFLLKNGPKTPLEISRETGINRTKIYRLIDDLLLKKTIEKTNIERGLILKAADPVNLKLFLIEKEEELNSNKNNLSQLITNLSTIATGITDDFQVYFYHGVEGLKQLYWNELKTKERLVFGYENTNEFLGKRYADTIRNEMIKRKIHVSEIGNALEYKKEDQSFYSSAPGWEKMFKYRQIPESTLKIRHGIHIYNNTVSIVNWKGKQTGIEIINKPLAEMQRQNFWHYWKIAK